MNVLQITSAGLRFGFVIHGTGHLCLFESLISIISIGTAQPERNAPLSFRNEANVGFCDSVLRKHRPYLIQISFISALSRQTLALYDPSSNTVPNEVANAILRKHNNDIATYKSEGTTIYSQENRLLAYLHDKGINADVSCSSSDSMSNYSIKNSLESGTVVKLSLAKGANLYDENGHVKQPLGGSHAVLITDVTEDGRYVITSWGEKYYVNPSQIYTDPKTGSTCSIINSYLTMNVNYK